MKAMLFVDDNQPAAQTALNFLKERVRATTKRACPKQWPLGLRLRAFDPTPPMPASSTYCKGLERFH